VRTLVDIAHARFAPDNHGKVAAHISVLAEADPAHFGICVTNTSGESFAVGDADHAFSMQWSAPFSVDSVMLRF
jgi:glutaminase